MHSGCSSTASIIGRRVYHSIRCRASFCTWAICCCLFCWTSWSQVCLQETFFIKFYAEAFAFQVRLGSWQVTGRCEDCTVRYASTRQIYPMMGVIFIIPNISNFLLCRGQSPLDCYRRARMRCLSFPARKTATRPSSKSVCWSTCFGSTVRLFRYNPPEAANRFASPGDRPYT